MSDWKNVQYKDGKMRTSEGGGGGGSSTFAGLDDVNFSNIQNGQVPKYNSTTQKWENADESGGGGNVDDVEVNGVSVVDAQKVAKITSYKEVTLAEYQALPSSKLSDNVLYCIKDTGGADSFPPLIYSDEEREIGVWRDGKPLYKKTITGGSVSTNQEVHIDVSSLNIERMVGVDSNGTYFVREGQYIADIPLNYNVPSSANYGVSIGRYGTYLSLNTGDFSISSYAITLIYTKTTDTAGSGTWTSQGGYAHHYSTTEHVVGTWIDGKPLYEKTIYTTISSTTQWIDTGVNSTDLILFAKGCLIQNNAITLLGNSDPAVLSGIGTLIPSVVTSGKWSLLYRTSSSSLNSGEIYITIQYTKTTD